MQGGLGESLQWEQMVLQQAQHYQVVPLILINLKGCPQGPATQELVNNIKVGVPCCLPAITTTTKCSRLLLLCTCAGFPLSCQPLIMGLGSAQPSNTELGYVLVS